MVHFTEKTLIKRVYIFGRQLVPNRGHYHYRNKDTFKLTINFPIKQPRNGQSDLQSGGEPKNSMTKEDAACMQNNMVATELIKKASQHALRPLQLSMKTRAKKEEPNSLVVSSRIPGTRS